MGEFADALTQLFPRAEQAINESEGLAVVEMEDSGEVALYGEGNIGSPEQLGCGTVEQMLSRYPQDTSPIEHGLVLKVGLAI